MLLTTSAGAIGDFSCWGVAFGVFWIVLVIWLLWLLAIAIAVWTLRVAQFFGYRMPQVAARPLEPATAKVAVIVPVKGSDEDTQGNLEALLQQNYARCRLIFVVQSADDPVCRLLDVLVRQQPQRVMVVVAGNAQHRGQKVHNQLAGVAATSSADDILAFMDADAHPDANWLHALVQPLHYGPHIGATTGYRFYVPAQPTGANHLLCLLNAMVGSFLGPYRRAVAWGGSMAIRREDFFNYGVYDAWQGALSDDYALTWQVKKVSRRKIHFVPQCLVASRASFNATSLREFVVRQLRITRICSLRIWLAALSGALLYLFALLGSWAFAIAGLIEHKTWWPWCAAVFICLCTLSILRGFMLLAAARRLLPKHWAAIRPAARWFILGVPLAQLFMLTALLQAGFGRILIWRGIRYRMRSRSQTQVLGPVESVPP
ncbi:MAG: glycosyltransferase family 2 protein [Phycisphaerae bacterium]